MRGARSAWSLMASFQVFFVRGIKVLYGRGKHDDEFAAIEDYFKNPNPDALIIFVADHLSIPADVRKQNFSTMSHLHWYVDTLRDCRRCKRPFLFLAREQQYWYETLRFRVETDCYECVECRASLRTVRRRLKRYRELVGKRELTDEDMLAPDAGPVSVIGS